MIQELIIDNHVIKYQISYKNNKNTYFYFKRDGYIQVNASKRMNEIKIKSYIIKNKKSFIKKYDSSLKKISNENTYNIFGEEYKPIYIKNARKIEINYAGKMIYLPNITIDQLDNLYKKFEKEILIIKLDELKQKYIENGFIDISNINFKSRYMDTRFGSCNPTKNNININLYLTRFDEKYLEYVFLHEITHLIHQNHSVDFYDLLGKLSTNYKQLKKELNNKFINR